MRDRRLTEAEQGTVGPSWGRLRCQPSCLTRLLCSDPLRLSPQDSHRRGWSGWKWVQGCSFHARLGMTMGSRVLCVLWG